MSRLGVRKRAYRNIAQWEGHDWDEHDWEGHDFSRAVKR